MSRDFTNFQFPHNYSKTSPNIFITFKKTWLITAFQLYIASDMVREKAKFNLHKLKLTQQQQNHYMKWFSLCSEFSNLKNKKTKKEKKRKERERERERDWQLEVGGGENGELASFNLPAMDAETAAAIGQGFCAGGFEFLLFDFYYP